LLDDMVWQSYLVFWSFVCVDLFFSRQMPPCQTTTPSKFTKCNLLKFPIVLVELIWDSNTTIANILKRDSLHNNNLLMRSKKEFRIRTAFPKYILGESLLIGMGFSFSVFWIKWYVLW
jgi:hypothetical protein